MSQREIPSSWTAYTSHKDDLLRMALKKGWSEHQFAGLRDWVEHDIKVGLPRSGGDEYITWLIDWNIHNGIFDPLLTGKPEFPWKRPTRKGPDSQAQSNLDLHRSKDYVSQIFLIQLWATRDGGYTDSQFNKLQREVKEGVVGGKGPCFMVEEWIAYCIDYLMYERVFGGSRGPFPFEKPASLPCAYRLTAQKEAGDQLAQARGGESTNSSRGNKVQGYNNNRSTQQTDLGIPSSQTTSNRSDRGRNGTYLQNNIITNIPTGPRAVMRQLKGEKGNSDDQGPKIKRENVSPDSSQSRPGIGGDHRESEFQTQSADISRSRRGSRMGVQGAHGVPDQAFKSERVQFQENNSNNDNMLSQHVDRKASDTGIAAPAVVKQEHYLSGTKRKIKVEEEEEEEDSRPVSKQRR